MALPSVGMSRRSASPAMRSMVLCRPMSSTTISSPAGPKRPAVCVPPDARLILHDVPERLQHDLAVGPIQEVTFVQLSATPFQFRDAVRFSNGREIRLQELSEGMRVQVLKLSLPEDSSFEPDREERKEVFVE